jgi:hypothetical protein
MGRPKGSKNKPKPRRTCEWHDCEDPVNAHGHHCDLHTCQFGECTAGVDEDAEYENCCENHMCEFGDCTAMIDEDAENGDCCTEHMCHFDDCTLKIDEHAEYKNCCVNHMCEFGDCTAMVDRYADQEDCCAEHMCEHSSCTLIVDDDSYNEGNNLCTWHDEQRQENEAAEAEVESEQWREMVHDINAPYADDSEDEGWYN